MEITKEQKEAIEYLEKYTKQETYGERNLEKDIITVLELLKETQRKLKFVDDYNYWVQLAVDRGIKIENLQNKNEKLKSKLLDTLKGQKVIEEETSQCIKEDYMTKEEIEDKIRKLEYYIQDVVSKQITMLQETLKESEEQK